MIELGLRARDLDGIIEEILDLIQRYINKRIFYFHGWNWNNEGATALLSYMARVLPCMKDSPSGSRFGRIIYLDCSKWESKRAMQRKIAEELKLDRKTMAMFEEQDKEDDFNGVNYGSRDVIRNVAIVIDKTLRETRFMVIFINGSNNEVILSPFGIPEFQDHVVIWTFTRNSTIFPRDNLQHTKVILRCLTDLGGLTSPQLSALLREEAATSACLRGMDLTMAMDCSFYRSFLNHGSNITPQLLRGGYDPSAIWICDGVTQTREICDALHPEFLMNFDNSDAIVSYLSSKTRIPYLSIQDDDSLDSYEERTDYRWIFIQFVSSITFSENKKLQEKMQTTLATASSIILGRSYWHDGDANNTGNGNGSPCALLDDVLFKQCNNLRVLILTRCSFSFVSPPFLHCQMLRFLGLDKCTDDNRTQPQGEDNTSIQRKWACLHSLQVLRLYHTEWAEIFSEENIDLMTNLVELIIEGVWCWQWISGQLKKRLPQLQRLRIIRPRVHQAKTSTDASNSFLDMTELEVLDLSGNSQMKSLPTILSKACRLQEVILDDCFGLENVVLCNSSVRSFLFSCYEEEGERKKERGRRRREEEEEEEEEEGEEEKERHCGEVVVAAEKYSKISKISLEGCTHLEKLRLNGLSNLVELDLSGCAIKILDFDTMLLDVPRLERIFLLGCERLHAIKIGSWLPPEQMLLCIDTRPARSFGCARPSIAQHEGSRLQVHAADARLARSLYNLVNRFDDINFNISITSSTACSGAVQPEATICKEMIESSDDRQHYVVPPGLYGDVFSEVGDAPIPIQAFPQPPTPQSNHHIEISDGIHITQSELTEEYNDELETGVFGPFRNLGELLARLTESLLVHDALVTTIMPAKLLSSLVWCRVERCHNLDVVFPSGAREDNKLETIWASDLLKARCIWCKGRAALREEASDSFATMRHLAPAQASAYFASLRHLHLRSCPSIQYALPLWSPSFPSLETLHIIHCGGLRHVFEQDGEKHQGSVEFPKLTTIHLHDLPALQQICEGAETLTPALETIKIRGCWSLRQLPALKGRKTGMKKPSVEVEKNVWDALKWDGVDAGHHPSLYEVPMHSRYYRQGRLLRGTVLR